MHLWSSSTSFPLSLPCKMISTSPVSQESPLALIFNTTAQLHSDYKLHGTQSVQFYYLFCKTNRYSENLHHHLTLTVYTKYFIQKNVCFFERKMLSNLFKQVYNIPSGEKKNVLRQNGETNTRINSHKISRWDVAQDFFTALQAEK